MSVKASVALNFSRTLLNDEQGTNWHDQKLFPKLKVAYNQMLNEIVANGVPIINATSTIFQVNAISVDDNNVDLSTQAGYPTNMLTPIWMKERAVGQSNKDFVDMTEVEFVPNVSLASNQLIWWCWIGGIILVRGATTPVQVQIRYRRQLTPPVAVTDDLVVTLAETYLGPQTAYIAMTSLPNYDMNIAASLRDQAKENLDNVIRAAVQQLENLPAKRRPYHRGRGRSRAIRDF